MTQTIVTDFHDAFRFDSKTGVISAEISSVPNLIAGTKHNIVLQSKRTGRKIEFTCKSVDMDSSEEDIYGWNYVPVDAQYKKMRLLIIND